MENETTDRVAEVQAMKTAWAVREAAGEIIHEYREEIIRRASAKLAALGVPIDRNELEKLGDAQIP